MSTTTTDAGAWGAFWTDYYGEHSRAVQTVATEYPSRRGLEVSYRDLLDHGVDHDRFKTDPDAVLGEGVAAFESFVREHEDVDTDWERGFDTMILHVTDLPDGFLVFDYTDLLAYLNRLIYQPVTMEGPPERQSDLMEAAFDCPNGHRTRLHQPGRRRRELDRCPECGESTYLEERASLFGTIFRGHASVGSYDDVALVIGGERWSGLDVTAGDEVVVTGIPRADFRADSTHGDVYVDVLSLSAEDGEGSLF